MCDLLLHKPLLSYRINSVIVQGSLIYRLDACCYSFFRLKAQKTKYLGKLNTNQTRTKRPNVSIFCDLFRQKVDMSGQAVFCLNRFSTPTLARTRSFCACQPHKHLSIMADMNPSVSGNPSGETSNKRKGKGRKPGLPNYQNDKLIPIIERILRF